MRIGCEIVKVKIEMEQLQKYFILESRVMGLIHYLKYSNRKDTDYVLKELGRALGKEKLDFLKLLELY